MKYYFLIPLLALSFITNSVFAQNQLVLTQGVNLHLVNGKEFKPDGTLLNRSNIVYLNEGTNQLVVSYTAEVKNGSDYELETSNPMIISFTLNNQAGKFNLPVIKTESDMRRFSHSQNWSLRDSNKKNIPLDLVPLPLKGFRIGVDYEREIERYNRKNNIVSADKITESIIPLETVSVESTEQAVILKMLEHWYRIASPKTQQQFLDAIK